MKINPELQIVERVLAEAEKRESNPFIKRMDRIKNNRKKTKGRNIQKIVTITKNWPPLISVKYIKHRF
jgi:hypothetical protein